MAQLRGIPPEAVDPALRDQVRRQAFASLPIHTERVFALPTWANYTVAVFVVAICASQLWSSYVLARAAHRFETPVWSVVMRPTTHSDQALLPEAWLPQLKWRHG